MMSDQAESKKYEKRREHVNFLRELKNKSVVQQKIIDLFSTTRLSNEEQKFLDELFAAEFSRMRAENSQNAVLKKLNAAKERERKKRTRKLIELGALFALVELENCDREVLLGLLSVAKDNILNDSEHAKNWRKNGQELLSKNKVLCTLA